MVFHIYTLFPNIFSGFLHETIIQRAQKQGLLTVNLVSIRDYAHDRHQTVDGTPYGGGAGMIMKIEPIYYALRDKGIIQEDGTRNTGHHVTLLSPRGRHLTQRVVEEYAKKKEITFICGRYEGVDQRVSEHLADEELSIGPYVLSGGEVAAMVVIEAVSRLIPGVLGNPASLQEETHDSNQGAEYPQYTKPDTFRDWEVPEVLRSGNHGQIQEWRKKNRYALPGTGLGKA